MKKILFVASEGVPFIKTGGLADVVGSLPKYLDKRYFDVRVFLPKYACMKQEMKDKLEYIDSFYMDYNWQNIYVGLFKAEVDGITYYFIDNEYYFSGPKVYNDDPRYEIERYTYFCKAVLSSLPILDFSPHVHPKRLGFMAVQFDVTHIRNVNYHMITSSSHQNGNTSHRFKQRSSSFINLLWR